MKISELSVHRPVSTVVGILLIALFGSVAIKLLPIQMKPTVDRPVIHIETIYPGAAPTEVEEQITDKLEEKLNSVEGLHKLSSESGDSRSSINMEFAWDANRDVRFLDVLQKVNQIQDLPEEAEEPVITAVSSVDEEKIMWIMLTSEKLNVEEMSRWADKEIQESLERVDGVGSVQVFGKREREISVILNPKAMLTRQVTVAAVRQALLRDNLNVRGGYIDEGKMRYHVRTLGKFDTVPEMSRLVVARNETGTVYLEDIARVRDGHERVLSIVRGDGKPMIAIGVARKHGANVVRVVENVEIAISALNHRFARFPYQGGFADLKLTAAYKESDYIWESLNFLRNNLIAGFILAAAVLLWFLKSLRATLIVSVIIPICFISIFLFLQLLDRTINIISLAGIAFAAGMTVDNAIVVVENIYRHLEMGKSRYEAAIEGTSEVWGAILASTLTTIAVFFPVFYVQEEAGLLFKDIAITIACSVGMSLILSLTVIPMLSARYLKVDTGKKPGVVFKTGNAVLFFLSDLVGKAAQVFFMRCTELLTGKYFEGWQRKRLGFAAGVLLKLGVVGMIVAMSVVISRKMLPPIEYLPSGNRNLLLVIYKMHPGINVFKGSEIALSMEEKILALQFDPAGGDTEDNRVVERMFSIVSSQFSVIGVILKDKYARMPLPKLPMRIDPRTKQPFRSALDYMAFNISGLTFGTAGTKYAITVKPSLFDFLGKKFEVEARGPDIPELHAISMRLQKALAKCEGFSSVTSEFEMGLPEIHVRIDREKAADLGLKTLEIAEIVEILVAGRDTGTYRDGADEIDIVVQGEEDLLSHIEELKQTAFIVPGRGPTTLESVADIGVDSGPTNITHEERERSIALTVSLPEDKPLQEAAEQVQTEVIDKMASDLPPGYHIEVTGSASDLERTKKAFVGTFWLSAIITYLLMASLFESFFYPFIIMFSVPFAVVGSIVAVKWNGVPMDMLTVLGFVILCGIVVNNAILVVHQSLNFQRSGMDPQQAIRESVRTRLRPAFMSSITTVFGMLPMCFKGSPGSELYSGLATAIVGGLICSTLFTLIAIPALMSLLQDFRRRAVAEL